MKRNVLLLLIVFILVSACVVPGSADNAADVTVVFTHDLHSHVEQYLSDKEKVGGFARIKTIIDNIRSAQKNTIVVDAGDFSMGTLYHTKFTTEAIEYRLLSQMGFDAIALGNHEFDFKYEGLLEMIESAKSKSSSLSPIICTNIVKDNQDIQKYTIITKYNFKVAVFSLIGNDAADVTFDDTVTFDNYIESAKSTVKEINDKHNPDVIICLSHCGTGESVKDEDIKLAKSVPDIDVIISAHTHSTLKQPIIVGDTIIASAGEYGEYVGEINLKINGASNDLVKYSLHKVSDSIIPDAEIENSINVYKNSISEYLSDYGFKSSDQVIAHSNFDFPDQNIMGDSLSEQPLGNLISDSYIYAVREAEGDRYEKIDVAIAPLGVIRGSIAQGDVTVNDAFGILSLGVGADGTAGYPLCSVYLYGSELWQIAEIDASVSSIMSYAQLYSSGLEYKINTKRMFLNRVYDCTLSDNGKNVIIEDDKLYRVVSGITSAEMLGTVKDKSFGLLEITPKDKNGNPIVNFEDHILHDENGKEIKEWVAFAKYLSSFQQENGDSVIPESYSKTQCRKNIIGEFDFSKTFLKSLFVNWTLITWVIFIVINILVTIIVIVIYKLIKKHFDNKRNSRGSDAGNTD